MKSKTTQITLIYIIISLFLAVAGHKLLIKYASPEKFYFYNFLKDIFFILATGLIFKYILIQNKKKSIAIFKKLNTTNEEIKESNEKYDIVAKATSDTIWDWKIQQDTISWNKGIENVFGYDTEEVGKTSRWWFDKIHPEDSIRMSIKLYSFIEQKTEKWQDQYRFKCKDGSYKYVLDRGFLLKDENGRAIRMIGAIQDITKQKEEEQRLKLLETVITQSKDSILITEANSEKGKIPKIVYINPAFSQMSGYQSNEIIGKSPNIFRGPKSDSSELKKLLKAIKNEEEFYIETISYTKQKKEYWVRFSMIPIFNSDTKISHWISIQRDITDEKKLETEKEHLIRELTQNNKDLKQFSYITSHNLRAPLSNLIGLLNLIEDIPVENPELDEILSGFSKSTHLLNETINDLVKVIIIKDNPSMQKEEVSLKEVFENVLSQLAFQIELHKPIIKLKFDQTPSLHINKAYIDSILLNLLTNSIKYKSENRKLKITITAEQIDHKTILTFKDNGIGIDLERNRDKVFGLYQRFHNYPDSKGLGLYLVKSQVETMGGTISIDSEVNKGTTFTITFKNQ
ncbi:PAS domain S-box protein [Flavobacterium sp. Fl-77]|uniref:histidine kinase n=1 Tax=Flavobacterium flavipigmentatum TaxID=2893884 RepID=A0AAJ2SEZ5_9FLAO|nr:MULTISPECIES: PAS domain-containing protein [unclassified Flavobacterium]MDX6183353.1 PAS domain S-box protein [Flavobacterium sp. Fl-33]MDX6186637.1 PAS domain S-box protein [Flavobacterium sp. Fl-77]UFH38594.1 PAS domain S-box protein [Flavobacterium sp. F-70]